MKWELVILAKQIQTDDNENNTVIATNANPAAQNYNNDQIRNEIEGANIEHTFMVV